MDEELEPQVPAVEAPKTPRELAMEAVVASREAVVRKEYEDEGQVYPGDKVSNAPVEAPPTEEDDLQLKLQEEQDAPVVEAPEDQTLENLDQVKVKIKVDGQERLVPVSELVRTAQKHESADKRLAEATRLLADAQAQAKAAAASPPATNEQQIPDTVDKAVQDPKQQAKEFLDAMFRGDEGQAQEILAKLVTGRPSQPATAPQPQDPEEIASRVEASLERRSALKQFSATYPEILKDQDLAQLADMKLARRIGEGADFGTAIMEIGEELYLKSGHKKPAAVVVETPPVTPASNARLERKQSADPIRGRNVSAATTQEQPDTPSSIVAQMKQARERGQWSPKRG
jgi:hypothetical protein